MPRCNLDSTSHICSGLPWPLVCAVLGCGLLWPWQAMLNSLPYYDARLPSADVSYWAGILFNAPQLLTELLVLAGRRQSTSRARLVSGYGTVAVLMAVTPLVAATGSTAFLFVCLLAGVCTAVIETSLFGLCPLLGDRAGDAIRYILVGEAVAAIAANVLQVSLTVALGVTSQVALLAYFSIAAALLLTCLLLVPVLTRLAVMHGAARPGWPGHGQADGSSLHKQTRLESSIEVELTSVGPASGDHHSVMGAVMGHERPGSGHGHVTNDLGQWPAHQDGKPAGLGFDMSEIRSAVRTFISIASTCRVTVGCVFANMAILFSVFPGVLAQVEYKYQTGLMHDKAGLWTLLLFGLFSSSDLIGRYVSNWDCLSTGPCGRADAQELDGTHDTESTQLLTRGPGSDSTGNLQGLEKTVVVTAKAEIVAATDGICGQAQRSQRQDTRTRRILLLAQALTVLRLALIPVFITAARGWSFAGCDVVFALSLVLFGVSHGYVSSLVMVAGPALVPHQDRDAASMVHVFFRVGGLFVGSLIGRMMGVLVETPGPSGPGR